MPAASLLRIAAVSLLLAAALPGRTRADDWRVFRRDGRRTAASSDRLRFPLTQLWSVVPQLDRSILYDVAVAEGRVYYLSHEGGTRHGRHLYCANSRTGRVKWQAQLSAALFDAPVCENIGPVVGSGVVYAYDQPPYPSLIWVEVGGFETGPDGKKRYWEHLLTDRRKRHAPPCDRKADGTSACMNAATDGIGVISSRSV